MHLSPVDRRRWRLVGVTLALSFAFDLVAAWFSLGWTAAAASTGVLLGIIGVYLARTRDPIVGRLLAFGLMVGFGELPADHFGVVTTQTLVYPPGPPLIWDSPFYMPFAWSIIFVQLGFVAWWLGRRWGLRETCVALAIFGGINIPIYEFLAKYADYWFYKDTPMLLGVTPYYVILAESLLSLALPLVVAPISERTRVGLLIALAAAESLWIFVAGWIAFSLVG
jgi:uncharacterized membrane protein YuzA (DUF378 family)